MPDIAHGGVDMAAGQECSECVYEPAGYSVWPTCCTLCVAVAVTAMMGTPGNTSRSTPSCR